MTIYSVHVIWMNITKNVVNLNCRRFPKFVILRKYDEDWNTHDCHLLLEMARVWVSSTRLRRVIDVASHFVFRKEVNEALHNLWCISMSLSARDVARTETLGPKVANA